MPQENPCAVEETAQDEQYIDLLVEPVIRPVLVIREASHQQVYDQPYAEHIARRCEQVRVGTRYLARGDTVNGQGVYDDGHQVSGHVPDSEGTVSGAHK